VTFHLVALGNLKAANTPPAVLLLSGSKRICPHAATRSPGDCNLLYALELLMHNDGPFTGKFTAETVLCYC
jgi:hypothetical protein